MVKKTSGKKKGGISVDMSGVESGGGRPCRDGRWKAYPTSCELTESSTGNDMLKFRWKVTSGPDKGATIWDNVSLTPQALWRLKTLMEVMEMDVPDGSMEVDPDDFVGEDHEIVIEIINEKYQGKDQARIMGFGGEESEDEEDDNKDDDDDDQDDKPAKKPKSSKKPSKDEEEEDDDDKDEEEEEEEEEKPAKKPKKTDAKLGKTPKIKEGSKVKFEDDDGDTVKGTVTEVDDDTVKVEDKKGTEWEVPLESVELQ